MSRGDATLPGLPALPGLPGLTGLALQRSLPLALAGAFLVLAWLLLDRTPLGAESTVAFGPEELDRARRALARHSTLLLLGCLSLAWTMASAANAAALWRRRDAEWLVPRSAPRSVAVIGTWCGTWLAACFLLSAAALTAEVAAGEGPPGLRPVAELEGPRVFLLPGAPEASWELAAADVPEHGSDAAAPPVRALQARALQVRARVTPTYGGGRAADVRFRLERGVGSDAVHAEVTGRVAAPRDLWLALPRGDGPLRARLTRIATDGGGAVLALDRGALTLFEPAASERLASVVAAAHLSLAGTALIALALGLASWMRAGLALMLLASALLAAYVHAGTPELLRAIELLRGGFVPPWPTLASGAIAGALSVVGLLLTYTGRARWEREP